MPRPGDPQALNRYNYTRNNPISLIDPDGHDHKNPEKDLLCKYSPAACLPEPQLTPNGGGEALNVNDGSVEVLPGPGGTVMARSSGKGVFQKFKDTAVNVATKICSGILALVCGDWANKTLEKLKASTANTVERLPIPQVPSGMSVPQFGANVMKWGSGYDTARARISTITKDWLVEKGVSVEIAQEWLKFYVNEALRNPNNPSAQGRAELMQHVVKLLTKGGD